MAAYLLYIVLHVSVCGLSVVGVVLLQPGCVADATFDCTRMLNAIAKLAPGPDDSARKCKAPESPRSNLLVDHFMLSEELKVSWLEAWAENQAKFRKKGNGKIHKLVPFNHFYSYKQG